MKEQIQQFKNLIEGKDKILLLSHKNLDGDGLSAMLVLHSFLSAMGKDVSMYSDKKVSQMYKFLPRTDKVTNTLSSSNDFIISVKCGKCEVDKLKYSLDGDTLNIVITPKEGVFHADEINSRNALGNYDLIIIVDSGDLEHLGQVYEENTEMFYNTPIVNIDHHVSNTGYGQLNMVDITASSSTQIVYNILLELGKKDFINSEIATLLLTGLIVDTGSFQHTNTSPSALEMAADLIEMGAEQQDIIQNVYKTKPLSTLKLWGRVLSKIEENQLHRIVWSTITKEDLMETGASEASSDGLIDELMTNAPGAEIVILMKDSFDGEMSASLRSTSVSVDTLPISANFGGGGHKMASGFKQKGHNFNLFIADVISFAEEYQKRRLNLSDEDIAAFQSQIEKEKHSYPEHLYKSGSQQVSKKDKIDIVAEVSPHKADKKIENKKTENSTKNEKKAKSEHTNHPNKTALNKSEQDKDDQKKNHRKAKKNKVKKIPQKNEDQSQERKVTVESKTVSNKENKQDTVRNSNKTNSNSPQNTTLNNQEKENKKPVQEPAKQEVVSNTQSAKTEESKSQAMQSEITKEQALYYAKYYVDQLYKMDVNSPEYAKIYEYYQYYDKLAKTL